MTAEFIRDLDAVLDAARASAGASLLRPLDEAHADAIWHADFKTVALLEQAVIRVTEVIEADSGFGCLRKMLIEKNVAYGDSSLNPVGIMVRGDPTIGIRARIDDKLSRLARGSDDGEDTVRDLLGYLVLFQIAEMRAAR